MAGMFETKLPPEVRLEVYKHLLTVGHRLTRVEPTECRGLLAQTSILATNKLVYKEAVEVFRDVNTFAVPLRELCQGCNPNGASKSAALLKKSGTVTVVVEGCSPCCEGKIRALFRSLEGRDLEVIMMDGSFRLVHSLGQPAATTTSTVGSLVYNFSSGASLICRYPAISCALDYVNTIPPDQSELGLQDAMLSRPDVKASFRRAVCSILEGLLEWHYYDEAHNNGVVLRRNRRYEVAYHMCRTHADLNAHPRTAFDATWWLQMYLR
ncbi:hypothetical protein LTR56_013646 [Elasticomyces elasticus]|nr:hypothetical protein LTR22_023721 [Elasticomyces elasticus]KAK3637473.1 hypothetical protein LTR56_013646 [Elasticomyces elasticus]KAK4917868.1 hypothetical protein LTR49_014272 [Elasticomyces elasticus]KAK5757027.1 hypothetical protein LTS12_012841 [Elasticomyces elasticus]